MGNCIKQRKIVLNNGKLYETIKKLCKTMENYTIQWISV